MQAVLLPWALWWRRRFGRRCAAPLLAALVQVCRPTACCFGAGAQAHCSLLWYHPCSSGASSVPSGAVTLQPQFRPQGPVVAPVNACDALRGAGAALAAMAGLQINPMQLHFRAAVGADSPVTLTLFNPHPVERVAFKVRE